MMRITRIMICVALVLAAVSSCTHNDGDIGPWFGTWYVETASVDGEVKADFPDSVFFQFQSSVFCLRKVYPHQQYYAAFGTWADLGNNTLRIVFPDTAMRPIAAVGLDSVSTLRVEEVSSHRAVLSMVSGAFAGRTIRYTLRHLP